jgi:predicted MPP superfamily phosphohydrolase
MTLTLTAIAVVIGLAGAATAMRTRADGATAAVRGLLVAGGLATLAFAAALVATTTTRLDHFGVAHLLYLLLTISLPLTGVGILVHAWRAGERHPAQAAGVLLLVPAFVGAYATHIAPFRLHVDRVSVAVDDVRNGTDDVRIAVLADLQTAHVGDLERDAIDAVLAADADIILLPGDLFQGEDPAFERELPALRDELRRLDAPGGVFYVRGDTEHTNRADRALEDSHVQILDGEIAEVEVGDRTVLIGGHGLDFWSDEAVGVREELLEAAGAGAITILLAHRPDSVLELPSGSPIDLTVAGHTHGGQVVLPFVGPLVTLTAVPRDVARGGLHEVDGNRIYVHSGVGMERGQAPQIRFPSDPSVTVLTLTGAAG